MKHCNMHTELKILAAGRCLKYDSNASILTLSKIDFSCIRSGEPTSLYASGRLVTFPPNENGKPVVRQGRKASGLGTHP